MGAGILSSIADRFGAVIAVTVLIGVPLGFIVAEVLRRRRIRTGWAGDWARRSALAEVGVVVGTAPWVWMIMTPTDGPGGLNLVPFRDLSRVLSGQDAVVQLVGNLLVFAALGFLLPVRFRLGPPAAVVGIVAIIAATLSALLETLQLVLELGRVTSVDDVLVNAVGAAVAAVLSVRWWRGRRGTPTAAGARR